MKNFEYVDGVLSVLKNNINDPAKYDIKESFLLRSVNMKNSYQRVYHAGVTFYNGFYDVTVYLYTKEMIYKLFYYSSTDSLEFEAWSDFGYNTLSKEDFNTILKDFLEDLK